MGHQQNHYQGMKWCTHMHHDQAAIPFFFGEVTEYDSFMNAFQNAIGSKEIPYIDKLRCLNQHLGGEPAQLISACMHMDPFDFSSSFYSDGCNEAINLLDNEYGCPFKILLEYLNQLNHWESLKLDNAASLECYRAFLIKCKNALSSFDYSPVHEHQSTLLFAVRKLPHYMQIKWPEHANYLCTEFGKVPTFDDLFYYISIYPISAAPNNSV